MAKNCQVTISPQRGICHLPKNGWLNYWVLEVRELERGDFYKYSVLTTRSFATPGGLQKDMAFSKMITGWDRDLKTNHTISQKGLFFVFCFLFYTVCPGTVSDVHSLTNHQAQMLADTWPMAVPTQWAWGSRVINREKGALNISRFPRSARNLNRKSWCYSSYLPMKTATFEILALSQSCF